MSRPALPASLRIGIALLFILPLLATCARQMVGPPRPLPELGLSRAEVKGRLLDQYRSWQGVPYRFGGQSRNGIDCSAFIQLTYREHLNLRLPRTTEELARTGYPVPYAGVESGDLLFFKTGWFDRHIGIYLDRNRFIHVSTSNGVMISELTTPYWQNRFWQARRVFN